MNRFRSIRRGSGALALFALAIQFVVAFGHVHLPKNLAPFGPPAITASITLDGDAAGPVGKHHPAADVFCDICATLNLTAEGQPVAAALPAAPSYSTPVQARAASDAAPSQRRYLLAQSRAPPAV
jgi:hypothetical protein